MAKSSNQTTSDVLVFEKQNYLMLLASVLLIVVGFVAMYLDGKFMGFTSLNVSPILIVAGYAGTMCAILWRPDDETEEKETA